MDDSTVTEEKLEVATPRIGGRMGVITPSHSAAPSPRRSAGASAGRPLEERASPRRGRLRGVEPAATLTGACWSEASHCLSRRAVYETAKRGLDIVLALIGLILTSPLWVVLGAGCLISRSGPLLYTHQRVGRNGVEFSCYKFRTMVVGADAIKARLAQENHHDDQRTFKIPRDPRVTPVGRWLRKFSLDEVPQIVNVLLGDMSIVGPRPPLPVETALYSSNDWRRLTVRPGLTCTWQVSGRSEIPFSGQLALDLEYIDNRGIWQDLRLIVLTVPAVLSCRGSY